MSQKNDAGTIIYTITDEAPALATHSFLPMVEAFAKQANVSVETRDISLAARVLAQFPEQKVSDDLAELGGLVKEPNANIIKLPNISASIPQLQAVIAELQGRGHQIPDFPSDPKTDEEKETRARYAKVLGSAVNPVLREGNSDRRVAGPVKEFAKKNPHSMGTYPENSQSHVAHMSEGDFYSSEVSAVIPAEQDLTIEWEGTDGSKKVLKEKVPVLKNEVVDAARMSAASLRKFLQAEVADAKAKDVLFSIHLKATMMKVSDPILFGEAVKAFFAPVFEKHEALFKEARVDVRNGWGSVLKQIETLSAEDQKTIQADIESCLAERPALAMVDSDHGITNLHVPSDVIIDASMPAAIRSSGQMWGPDGKLKDTKFVIPDRSYAGVYREVVEFCKQNGAFDPTTMGNVANVGLMAKKAEEYGSHDKTFWIDAPGVVRVKDAQGEKIFEHPVESGDIWRMCQTKEVAIQDWVKLAVSRARATGSPATFWLDSQRAHDSNLIQIVETELKNHDTSGLEVKVLSPVEATKEALDRVKAGKDTISVTGNVLRDYLTDLFPILELGTSAKMLSIVPLLAGGGLYETGAGGSAPKHVQQLQKENHLRWDSLGEFLALAVSIESMAEKTGNSKAAVLAKTLDQANTRYLMEQKAPSRKVNELDNRGSHFYVALFWAEALANQDQDSDLKATFGPVAEALSSKEATIVQELNEVQGKAADLGGYYWPDLEKVTAVMRPSSTLNAVIDELRAR